MAAGYSEDENPPKDEEEAEERVRSQLLGPDREKVLRGLRPSDQEELITRIRDCEQRYEEWEGSDTLAARRRETARRKTAGQIQKLHHLYAQAEVALKTLNTFITDIGASGFWVEDNVYLGRYLQRPVQQHVGAALAALSKAQLPSLKARFDFKPIGPDPRIEFALSLEDFFGARVKGGCTKLAARWRIQAIFHRVWDEERDVESLGRSVRRVRKKSGQPRSQNR